MSTNELNFRHNDIQEGDLICNDSKSVLGVVVRIVYFPDYAAYTVLTYTNRVAVYCAGGRMGTGGIMKVMYDACL